MNEDFLTTKNPLAFVDNKVKNEGFGSLSDLEKSYYFFGKEMEIHMKGDVK